MLKGILKFNKSFTSSIVCFILLLFLSISINESFAEIIPSERRIDWKPGIPGGIPNRTTICANVRNPPYNAKGDGVTDDTNAIQNAINNCPQGQIVYIPEGRYRLNGSIEMFEKGVVLRGDGPTKTKLIQYAPKDVIKVYSWSSRAIADVLSGYTKGSNTIVVNDSSSFNVGDLILIDQLNDSSIVNITGWSPCTYCSRENGTRALGQMVLIAGKNGTTLTLNKPLYYTFNTLSLPQITKQGTRPPVNAGVEDLYVEVAKGAGEGSNIVMQNCIYCWVKNVESYNTYHYHINLSYSYGAIIRDSFVHHAQSYDSDRGYGVNVHHSSDNLVENNILYYLHSPTSLNIAGTVGNVFGYNYIDRTFDRRYPDTNWFMGSLVTHGAHTYMNLFEGNIGGKINLDFTHGSGSHNTFFRNYITRESQGENKTIDSALFAIGAQEFNYYLNFIGNILGKKGCSGVVEQIPYISNWNNPVLWKLGFSGDGTTGYPNDPLVNKTMLKHGNYECAADAIQWDPTISTHILPASLYLDQKPVFFEDLTWPSIGPGLNPMAGDLPAKKRFEQITARECEPNTYYVDSQNGEDYMEGNCTWAAWKHVPGDTVATDKAAKAVLKPGDIVKYRVGFEWKREPTCNIGDLNCDGSIDVTDAQLCINVFLGKETRPEIIARANLNPEQDQAVDVRDAQEIINIILGV